MATPVCKGGCMAQAGQEGVWLRGGVAHMLASLRVDTLFSRTLMREARSISTIVIVRPSSGGSMFSTSLTDTGPPPGSERRMV